MKDYTTNISVRIKISKLEMIDNKAEEKGITRNEMINIMLDEYLRGE
jgi:predicted DNA binding CopG/RHH family protein